MPDWTKVRRGTAPIADVEFAPTESGEDVTPAADESGVGVGTAAAGVAAGAGALYGLSKLKNTPGILGKLGKAANVGNAVRQQLMLSGFAPLKSVLGNIGAGVEQAIEGRGFNALKEILSRRTMREAGQAMRTGTAQAANPVGSTETVNLPAWASLPGRFMSGADEATRGALQRAGMSADEAENAVLQSPLSGSFSVLESPTARFVHPFRRTPFNQFFEGWRKVQQAHEGNAAARRGLAAYGTAGAAHGAATSDEQYPLSVPLGVAASSRYGLPYAAGAIIGRSLAGGKGYGGLESSALPVSEYGFSQSVDPRNIADPFLEPAAIRAFERLTGGR